MDSLDIANMIRSGDTNNIKLRKMIREIVQMTEIAYAQILHCFREANQVADYLAKLASSSGNSTFYTSFNQLPKEAKRLFQLDRWQLLSIRRRYDKTNFLLVDFVYTFLMEEYKYRCNSTFLLCWRLGLCPHLALYFFLVYIGMVGVKPNPHNQRYLAGG